MKACLAIVIAATLYFAAGNVHADPLSLRLLERSGSAVLTFEWPGQVRIHTADEAREIVMRFPRPVEVTEETQKRIAESSWVQSLTVSYDAVLVQVSRPVRFEVRRSGSTTSIGMQPQPGTQPKGSDLQLDLQRARLLISTQRFEKAEHLLDALASNAPTHPQVLAARADLASAREHRRRAAALYEQAAQLEPENEFYRSAARSLRRADKPRLSTASEARQHSGTRREVRVRLGGSMRWTASLRLGFESENNDVEADAVRLLDGTVDRFAATRRRHKVVVTHENRVGGILRAGLHFSGDAWGVVLQQSRRDARGSLHWRIDYNRPYWDILEGVVGGIRRDRLQVQRQQQLSRQLRVFVGASGNHYDVDVHDSAARTWGLEGRATWSLMHPAIEAAYGLDAEYVHSSLTLEDASGFLYRPVPLVSREVHSSTLSFSANVQRDLRAAAFAGFAWDRLGGAGPFLGAEVDWDPRRHVAGRLWFDQRLNAADTNLTSLSFGASILLTL